MRHLRSSEAAYRTGAGESGETWTWNGASLGMAHRTARPLLTLLFSDHADLALGPGLSTTMPKCLQKFP